MKIETFNLTDTEQANAFIKSKGLSFKDAQFLDGNIIVTYDDFDMNQYTTDVLNSFKEQLEKSKLDLAVLENHTHLEGEERTPVDSAIKQKQKEIKLLESKITACTQWLQKNS